MTRRLLLAALMGALCSPSVTLRAEKPTGSNPPPMPYTADTPIDSDLQVSVEIRILTVTDAWAKRLGVLDGQPHRIDDKSVRELFTIVQADPYTSIMQAPKLTLLNGQEASLGVSDANAEPFVTGVNFSRDETGLVATPVPTVVNAGTYVRVKPEVLADGHRVRLDLNVEQSDLEGPPPVTKTLVLLDESGVTPVQQIRVPMKNIRLQVSLQGEEIPDGCTELISGTKSVRQVREESKVPLLGDLPCIGAMFRSVRTIPVTEHTWLLVTPRIIILEGDGVPCGTPPEFER
jgi:type II secretory pathway component GspD/PulD (secretin)